ncbi:MAG: 2-succinyl-5-enolpyruvyl-6-hydroxy-3-cyclohexene-1-carboxylic-acid synthase [Bacteroidia bacterium]|nr:2-succinyl-5-enolpyruvyl-6-hydroxy-3-cyclohexene-1-carboxylic-acid synthase [Bacteroidia bacterium]
MVSNKRSVARMVEILANHDVGNVVFSPGSRNAPLIISFNEDDRFKCTSIHDERVAAFFALGIAQYTGDPVVLSCTSGSAAYNYAPAVAEAFFQGIPLIVCTADRPIEWVDQEDGQTIRQRGIYGNHVKKSFEFIQEANEKDELWYNDRMVNEAAIVAKSGKPGPVHINIPLREPIYDVVENTEQPKIIHAHPAEYSLSQDTWSALVKEWDANPKRMVIIGQTNPGTHQLEGLSTLVEKQQLVVMTETTSNVVLPFQIDCIDQTIEGLMDQFEKYQPDLLITAGGEIVSKKIKALLRKHQPKHHWQVNQTGVVLDTFQSLTRVIKANPFQFFDQLSKQAATTGDERFYDTWQRQTDSRKSKASSFLDRCEWSDLKVFGELLNAIPPKTQLHLANSTPIRYSQLFNTRSDITYFCNRGTSGIDGSTSTAAGMAYASEKLTTIIAGDTSFIYDSNALWIRDLSRFLRIIVINNKGGNIFRIIPGPDTTKQMEGYFEAAHDVAADGLAQTFDLPYYACENQEQLEEILPIFFESDFQKPPILEITTPQLLNDKILKQYFAYITS